jgi:hypothetical protein
VSLDRVEVPFVPVEFGKNVFAKQPRGVWISKERERSNFGFAASDGIDRRVDGAIPPV